MKLLALMGMVLLLASCGDSGDNGTARTGGSLCDEMCGWPDECFVALGVPLQGSECMQSCEASVEVVGVDCLGAIVDTIACIGTCDVESITEEQALACQSEAERVVSSCE
jgi:hypothetical protein